MKLLFSSTIRIATTSKKKTKKFNIVKNLLKIRKLFFGTVSYFQLFNSTMTVVEYVRDFKCAMKVDTVVY